MSFEAAATLAQTGEAAVIDVGSNSVRLVAYRIDGRAMTPFLNEKVMAGLGRGLARTGALSATGAAEATAALARFRLLLQSLEISQVYVVATAAVREARDGAQFEARVREETGFRLDVLPGAEEARLSALGVLSGAPEAVGLVGDLGGSSLELIPVSPEGPGAGETFPLGPLALGGERFDPAQAAALADAALAASPLRPKPGGAFYAVGGAWRALGRLDIAMRRHPIHVLHHHVMTAAQVGEVIAFLRKVKRNGLEKAVERLSTAAAKRAEALPAAAVVLERVLAWGGFSRVVLSAHGLREGVLFSRMAPGVRAEHPLIASAAAFGAASPRARRFGEALAHWIAPARAAAPTAFGPLRDGLLWDAAARLADVGAALHPDQRAEMMFDLVLRSPLAGLDHAERAFLAGAIHQRYSKGAPDRELAFQALLSPQQRQAAAVLGLTLRFAADLTGRAPKLMAGLSLEVGQGRIRVRATPALRSALTPLALRRLEPLAAQLGLKADLD